VAVLGPTASGKSALGIALAERFGGEVVACDSTAVYRGFDIGTDKVSPAEQRGIAHHLVDVVAPDAEYTAADYARDAAAAIRDIAARGRVPILVGGTGFYYRALVRGLFPGAGRDPVLRARLDRLAAKAGDDRMHRLLGRIDPPSAVRIQVRDRVRVVRALEVYFSTGRPLTAHFADTKAPLEGWDVVAIALRPSWPAVTARIATRVDQQFARGIVGEVRALVAAGVPPTARPFGGYVYLRVLEHLRGVRDEAATRDLIVRENRHYARRQLIWFRKEPNLVWIHQMGDESDALNQAVQAVTSRAGVHAVGHAQTESATHAADV
jgi:tRNA dimethylallyltransferase